MRVILKPRFLFLVVLGIVLAACSAHQKDLTTDVGTMAEADRLKGDEFFEEARKQYMRIKTDFPQSSLQIDADFKAAETYFLEESYPTAASSFEDFIRTYPGRAEIPKALFYLGMSYRNQMPETPQRDTRPSAKSIDAFTRLIVDFPSSEYTKDAQKFIDEARAQLAQKVYEIGRFYQRNKKWEAAARRYSELMVQYPDSSLTEEAAARKVYCLRQAGQAETAEALAKEFREKFPQSEFMSMIEP